MTKETSGKGFLPEFVGVIYRLVTVKELRTSAMELNFGFVYETASFICSKQTSLLPAATNSLRKPAFNMANVAKSGARDET